MDITLLSLLDGARQATGTVVIIDVYRAFTTAAVAFQQEADEIILVDDPDTALALRAEGRGDLCVGEQGGVMVPGFDYGNSPHALAQVDLSGTRLIQSTSAGTRGVVAASRADAVYVAALVNARATAAVLLRTNPAEVSLVAMGWAGRKRTDEDEQCALYLRNLLAGRSPDPAAVRSLVLSAKESAKFDDPAQPHFDPRDRTLALDIDRVPFAIRIHRQDGLLIARPEHP